MMHCRTRVPYGGTCDVLGEEVWRLDPRSRARFRNEALGFVFQVFNLDRGLGAGHARAFLPVWIQKDVGGNPALVAYVFG